MMLQTLTLYDMHCRLHAALYLMEILYSIIVSCQNMIMFLSALVYRYSNPPAVAVLRPFQDLLLEIRAPGLNLRQGTWKIAMFRHCLTMYMAHLHVVTSECRQNFGESGYCEWATLYSVSLIGSVVLFGH